MTTTAQATQYILLAGFSGILVACTWLFVTRPHRRFHIIPPGTWAVNGMLFYGALTLGILPQEIIVLWSATLRLHSVILVMGGLIISVWQPRRNG